MFPVGLGKVVMPSVDPIPSVAVGVVVNVPVPERAFVPQFSVPLTVKLVLGPVTSRARFTMAPALIVVVPPSVIDPDPEIVWAAVPLNTIACPEGNERAAPLLVRSPAMFIAPVIELLYVTPELIRNTPLTVSALPPDEVYVAAPAVRVRVRLPKVLPDALIARLDVPGTSYSKMPVSVPAAVDKSGTTPAVLRPVL
jgi:hypothetical protein